MVQIDAKKQRKAQQKVLVNTQNCILGQTVA